jgi:hypothetical protein
MEIVEEKGDDELVGEFFDSFTLLIDESMQVVDD